MKIYKRVILICIAALAFSGCVGVTCSSLPPKLSSHDADRVKEAHFGFAVGVETNTAGGDILIANLRWTELFDAVDYVDLLPSPPPLLARWERTPYGVATVPVRTILTLGVVPTTVREPYGFACAFYSSDLPESEVRIEYLYDSSTTIGWVAGAMALSSENVLTLWKGPQDHPRFRDQLRITILNRFREISPSIIFIFDNCAVRVGEGGSPSEGIICGLCRIVSRV